MFGVRAISIAPGDVRPYDAAEWCDAIVSVERGELELECVSGGCRRFRHGSLIWVCDLPLRSLRSTGPDSVLLVAVSRSDEFAPPRVSLRLDTPPSREEARAMGVMFVWFDLRTKDVGEAGDFYEKLLGWNVQGQEGHSMIAGDGGPWAAIAPHTSKEAKDAAWVPYVQVDDVDAATARAAELGATVLHEAMQGPAGRYSTIRDTGGAPIALWQPAA
jgi:predicted enzyme related to lactoylglutathione lyase